MELLDCGGPLRFRWENVKLYSAAKGQPFSGVRKKKK